MRAKSAILLLLALGCGLVAAIGVTQVISKNPEPTNQGDIRSIVVAVKDIVPGELITPQMVKLEPWPREKAPEDSLTEVAKVDGCRARDEIYQGEPIRERQLLGQGFTMRTATDYIPKGYRVVGVKVDVVTGGAGLIRPGDRVDVIVHFTKDAQKGVLENRTQTILQDIKVFAVDDVFKPDPGADERESAQAKVIQLLVTPVQAESLVLAQQLGKVQLTMRPPGGEDTIATPGKTPAELLGGTSVGDRASETSPIDPTQSGGGLLDFLNSMKKKPAAASSNAAPTSTPQPAPKVQSDVWSMRVLSGAELSDIMMEGTVDPRGEHVWRVSSPEATPSEPTPATDGAAKDNTGQDVPTQHAPTQDTPTPSVDLGPAAPTESTPPASSEATSADPEQPKE